ncbi:MAG: polyprenyl diphosphate synthase, partial [Candidatus Omnitrophica bacterium]|nr:polyprenyl diphosphate synthase [Candidatus Omnitrophota bacterium]
MKNIPVHVAIIMDGNGRWAQSRGLPRIAGHKEGISAVRRTVKAAIDCQVKYLTLYSFSTENWKRPPEEVNFLFNLMESNLAIEMEPLHQKNIRVRFAGRIDQLPEKLQKVIFETEKLTCNNSGLNLTFAINYGGRQEILDAFKRIVNTEVQVEELNENVLRKFFYCPELPDVDLMIRTAGEQRLSNFLLWQSVYAEFYFTKT